MIKIAFPSDDGKTISQHFGQAPLYIIATIQEGQPARLEQREKSFHGQHSEQHDHEHGASGHHHGNMLAPIADCQILIAGGMGQPAFESAIASGLQVIMTGETTIDAALSAYQAGTLVSDTRRVHQHRPSHSL